MAPARKCGSGFGFVRAALECALRGEPLEIWGDGSAIRDFLYIDDLVAAVMAALLTPKGHHIFNVASGTGHGLNDVVDLVQRISDHPLQVVRREGRRSDVHQVGLDPSLIRERLGWYARVGLEKWLGRTWQWV